MSGTVLFALPEVPDRDRRDTHWWHVVEGRVVEGGASEDWLALAKGNAKVVALAPAGQVRLEFAKAPSSAATSRQAVAVARVSAIQSSLGGHDSLHAVSDIASDGSVRTAVVDNAAMNRWLDWAKSAGVAPSHIVPVGAVLPLSERWTSAEIGAERVVGRRGVVLPNEPELAGPLIGDAKVAGLEEAELGAALAAAAETAPLDLRTGRFARRRGLLLIERNRVRELIILGALIPLLMLAWALVSIFKLERSTDRLNAETLAVASSALGRPVTLETAESELAQRTGGSAFGGLMSPLTATLQAMQAEQNVSATSIAYSPDGTFSVTLASPTVEGINRVLLALQSNGYKVTAVSRQATDGRQMADITVRSGP
jgi:general secretion pathway protein L